MDSYIRERDSISTTMSTPMNHWRRMDDGNIGDNSDLSIEPTPSPSENTNTQPSSSSSSGLYFVIFLLVAIPLVAFIIYRLYKRYQRRYEQQMLDYRSRQADRVLGDMQMIPNEDLDHHTDNDNFDDNELI
jgi:hypothetical protein